MATTLKGLDCTVVDTSRSAVGRLTSPIEVAAYYHRGLGALLFTEIRRPSHALGEQVGVALAAILQSARFLFDADKWQAWQKPGTSCHAVDTPDCRRFGEVRGIWTPGQPASRHPDVRAVEVLYDPRKRPDFHIASGESVFEARTVLILGRRMFASGPEIQPTP